MGRAVSRRNSRPRPDRDAEAASERALASGKKQTARLLIANGRLCRPSGFMGGTSPEAEALSPQALWGTQADTVARCSTWMSFLAIR
jgi:hypothetical protein